MQNQFSRTQMLLGKEALEKLNNSRVVIFGIGGVGGFTAEALCRSGVGNIDIVDNDKVALTNLNRQIIALNSTIGKYKVDVMQERLKDINPNLNINTYKTFYTQDTKNDFDFSKYNYVIDAIDTVTGKLTLIEECNKTNTRIISSMGTGNKINPEMLEIADIYKTSVCPLARVIRQELKKRNIPKLKVVYSKEQPIKPKEESTEKTIKHSIPASISFVPSVAGLIIAGEVVKDLTDYKK